MNFSETNRYVDLVADLVHTCDLPPEVKFTFMNFTSYVFRVEKQNLYAQQTSLIGRSPSSWIGLSIVAASLLCIFAMAADLLHGLRNRKSYGFHVNTSLYINSAFLSIISAAMKLPIDTTTPMPGNVDQVTKLGSMAFLCTMMANLLPSLATMNSKGLLTNILGLGVMVVTLVVNVCIQIQTGVISYNEDDHLVEAIEANTNLKSIGISSKSRNSIIAAVYVTLLLVLLIIHVCSSLAIQKSKKMIDVKYQQCHETISKELRSTTLTGEELRQHVSKYCIMAETGSPQLKTVCYVTTSACGVICVLSTALHIRILFWTIESVMENIGTLIFITSSKEAEDKSDYKWTLFVIFIIQFIGVILGTIVPLCRCFSVSCFKVSIKSIKNHIKVFKVESYWLEKLYDWKQRSITLPIRSHKCKVITEHVKMFLLKFCIKFQEVVVLTCKIISLVPFFMICAFYCLKCLKGKGKAVGSSKRKEESRVESRNKNKDLEDLRRYVLQLQDETEILETTLKWLSRSTERQFKKGERRQSKVLLELIKKSRCFKGDERVDYDYVTSLLSKEDKDCWSLPVVTLTTIAISLPGIDTSKADELLRSVNEGLVYVKHVEQSLDTTNDKKRTQMAAGTLWDEFEVFKTWFKNNMQEIASQNNTPTEIVQSFKEKGKENVNEEIVQSFKEKGKENVNEEGPDNGSRDDYSICRSICANSMYHITETILQRSTLDSFSKQQLFDHILQMISCILAVCLTNLPKVIVMKCHTSEIEKRVDNVQEIAKLLGETTDIINTLQSLDPNDDLPFIEKWCSCSRHALCISLKFRSVLQVIWGNTFKEIQDRLNLLLQEVLFAPLAFRKDVEFVLGL